jgi:hypothetical protein
MNSEEIGSDTSDDNVADDSLYLSDGEMVDDDESVSNLSDGELESSSVSDQV